MGVTPAEATGEQMWAGYARPDANNEWTIIEDKVRTMRQERESEKIQQSTRREELTPQTKALKP